MVIAAVGTVLAAAYLLWLYQRTAFGEPTEEFAGQSDAEHEAAGHDGHGVAHSLSSAANTDEHHDEIHDVQPTEWIAWTPFLIAIVVFGVYPQLMFKVLDPGRHRTRQDHLRRHPAMIGSRLVPSGAGRMDCACDRLARNRA